MRRRESATRPHTASRVAARRVAKRTTRREKKLEDGDEGIGRGAFRGLLESAPDALIIIDQGSRIVLVNRRAEILFGYQRQELLERTIDILIPERFRHLHQTRLAQFLEGNRTLPEGTRLELYALLKDGSELPVEISLSPFETEDGILVTGAIRDISNRRKAEEALRRAHDELEQRVQERTAELAKANVELQAEVAERERAEDQILRLNADLEGRVHERTSELEASETRLRLMLGQMPAILWTTDTELSTTSSMGAGLSNVDFSPYQMAGAGLVDFAPAPETSTAILAHRRALAGESLSYEAKYDDRIFQCHVEPLRDAGKNIIGCIGVALDVTESKQAGERLQAELEARAAIENELRELNEQLEQRVDQRTAELQVALQELESFSYSVSHDLSAPLRSVDGFSQILLEDYSDKLDTQAKDYLHRMRAASQRMAHLIDSLLNLARMSRTEPRHEQVDLSAIAAVIALELQQMEPERKVEFLITDGLRAQGDPGLLRVVLENLLMNAWKFTGKHPSGQIEFGTLEPSSEHDNKPVYFVRDDGAGFDMAYITRLFQPFQRLHSMQEFEGTGVGLATIQRIVQRHGGRIWAEGKIEQGATFYFTLA